MIVSPFRVLYMYSTPIRYIKICFPCIVQNIMWLIDSECKGKVEITRTCMVDGNPI